MTDASDTSIAPADGQSTPEVSAKWLDVIARYDRAFRTWGERVKKVHKIYTDERNNSEMDGNTGNRKLNIYWANIQTLQPAIYQKLPQPSVSRRWKDDDRIARVASEMIERSVTYMFDCQDMDGVMRQVRDDYLHGARGQAWVRYEPEIEDDQLMAEYVPIDYIAWSDFGHNVARSWSEVTCVWRKAYMTRAEGEKRFGDKVQEVGLDHKPDEDESREDDPTVLRMDKATVYEIWDKASRKVYFIAKSYGKGPLEVAEPFLEFEGFFPCPRPAYGTMKAQSLIPVPDYVLYQDQLAEIDELTQRMGKLLDGLKLVGFYPSSSDEASVAIEKAAKPGVENVLIPIPAFGEFKEGGGIAGKIEWWPVEQVVKVLQGCFEARKQLIDDIYQITGISDIVRGESDANETATAQQIKTQWGSIRIRDRQHELARFARDVARLVAEVICDKFQPETLLAMTNMKLPTDQEVQQQQALQALQAQLAAQQAPPSPSPVAAPQGGPPGPVAPPPGGPPSQQPGMMP
jgi:hypothetical protein